MCNTEKRKTMKRFDVYFADLGIHYDSNNNKMNSSIMQFKRPIIVLGNPKGLLFSPVVSCIPLTSNVEKALRKNLPVHVHIDSNDDLEGELCLDSDSVALCEQLTVISKDQLGHYIGTITKSKQLEIEKAVGIALGLMPLGELVC